MRKLGLAFLFSLLMGSSYAQGYFVLLQSGNRQPFYVRLGTQLYSSTQNGHLILSQLKDSSYTMAVGFPSRPGVEQSYVLPSLQKDQEFEIREHGEAGWDLYDMQTKEWLTVVSRSGGREEVRAIGVRRDDAFSRMMAGVVHDTAVLYNDYTNSELATSIPVGSPAGDTSAKAVGAAAGAPIAAADTPVASIPIANGTPVASTPITNGPPTTAPSTKTDTTAALITRIDTPVIKPEAVAAVSSRPDSNTSLPSRPDSNTGLQSRLDSNTALSSRPNPPSSSSKSDPSPAIDSSTRESLNRPIPSVVKLSERKLTRNMRLVYADKGKDAKSDTIVVIIPLDTPQAATAKPRNANPDSGRATAAKFRIAGPDSSHTSPLKIRNTGPDSSHGTALKSPTAGPDSPRPAAVKTRTPDTPRTAAVKPHTPDSPRTAAIKPRTPDSARAAARSKAPNSDSPANVRVIVPTPIAQPADKSRPNDSAKKPVTKGSLPYVNSDCHAFATDYDVDKLRVKMLEAGKDDDRIAAALKIFKAKCFYTRQIKALSEVFPTDASKFHFFETAYPFAADEHFRELGVLLNDPVFVNRFKTLVH